MQRLGELGAAASPPPSKLNPPLSQLCPGSIQYGSSHDKLKVKVLTVFLVVTKKGSPVMLILTSAPCVKPPWWPCPPSAEAGTLSSVYTPQRLQVTSRSPSGRTPVTKMILGTKTIFIFSLGEGEKRGASHDSYWISYSLSSRHGWWQPRDNMPLELNISVTAQWGLIVCGDTDWLLSGAAAELFAVFSVIPSFVLISHYPGLPQTLHIRTQQQPAARHCHLFSWLNSGSDGIK